jgi:predicted permease
VPDFRALVSRGLHGLCLRPEREAEIVLELAQQLEDVYAEARAEGLSEQDALARALAEVPSWETLERDVRAVEAPLLNALPPPAREGVAERQPVEGPTLPGLVGTAHDLRYALRQLRRAPGFCAIVALTLGLGMGLNAALFSLVNALLLRPLPFPSADRLVGVYCLEHDFISHTPMAFPDFRDLRDGTKSFEGLMAYALRPFALEGPGVSEVALGELVTPNYFDVLGVRAGRGRTFAPGEGDHAGSAAVVVISDGTWRRRFGADPAVVGKAIRLNGRPFTIVGVAPPAFHGLFRGLATEMWAPAGALALFGPEDSPRATLDDRLNNRGSRWISVIGRLRDGATLEQAAAEVALVGQRLEKEYPKTNRGRVFGVLRTSNVAVFPGVDRVLYAVSAGILALSGLVVLIACVNVANMLLARGVGRRREIAVRLSLGASRARLVRQMLTEGLLLALLGCGIGLLVVAASNAGLNALRLPLPVTLDLGLSIDARVLAYSGFLTVLTTLSFALAPALHSSRADVVGALKETSGTLVSHRRLAGVLVVIQVALSLVLLAGGGLLLRSLGEAHAIWPGFDAKGVALLETDPSLRGYSTARKDALYAELAHVVRGLRGVESVTYASHLPLTFQIRDMTAAPAGREPADKRDWPTVDTAGVAPGYFETLRIPILAGRGFDARDSRDAPPVVILNQTAARRLLPGVDPIGRSVHINGPQGPIATVVGVARDAKYRTLGEPPRAFLYQALRQMEENGWTLVVRARDPRALLPELVRTLRGVDDQVPIRGVRTLEDATASSLLLPRFGALLFGSFGVLGLALACVGLYGVVAHLASQRIREIGVRMALGAPPGHIYRLVAGRGLGLTLIGVAIGLPLALVASRGLTFLLYGVSPADPATFVVVPLAFLAVALAAVSLPAWRALRIDPQRVLRHD